jgi:Uma2 family endonuclease
MQPPTVLPGQPAAELPDHTQLPDKDGSIVANFQEHPQSNMLTECLLPRLREVYPDGQFCIGCDSGIYWRHTKEPLDGCKAPDWFFVPGVPPMLEGKFRRSYVLWQEGVRPLVLIEYVSGDGSEERETTPYKGKFWVYEQGICSPYYAIYEVEKASVELYALEKGRYRLVQANPAGRFPLEPWRVELGIWQGRYRDMDLPWLRVWDADTGKFLPLAEERAEAAESLVDDTRRRLDEECERAETERKRAQNAEAARDEERQRAETQSKRAEQLAEKLRAHGIDPDAA